MKKVGYLYRLLAATVYVGCTLEADPKNFQDYLFWIVIRYPSPTASRAATLPIAPLYGILVAVTLVIVLVYEVLIAGTTCGETSVHIRPYLSLSTIPGAMARKYNLTDQKVGCLS